MDRGLRRAIVRQQESINRKKGTRMIIDISEKVVDIKGEAIYAPIGVEVIGGIRQPILSKDPTTFAELLIDAVQDAPNEELPPKDKITIVRLQLMFSEPGVTKIELHSDDVAFIKKRAESLPSLGYFRVMGLLNEPESGPVESEEDQAVAEEE